MSPEDRTRLWLEFKATEGFRVQSVLASLGALPAAALVFGDSAESVAPGAPLYCAAILLLIGAYMHWMYTDGTFYMGFEHSASSVDEATTRWLDALYRSGARNQTMTFLYGFGNILCTLGGAAAVYGGMRLPVSVETGFAAVFLLSAVVFGDVFGSNLRRNHFMDSFPRRRS